MGLSPLQLVGARVAYLRFRGHVHTSANPPNLGVQATVVTLRSTTAPDAWRSALSVLMKEATQSKTTPDITRGHIDHTIV